MIKKLKICDNNEISKKIYNLYNITNNKLTAKWSIELAKHMLLMVNVDYDIIPEIIEGFKIHQDWLNNNAKICDIRKSGFKIHKLARTFINDDIKKNVMRVVGHAVSSGHMKEHAIVASDYAIKVINIMYNNDLEKVVKERNWQLEKLKEISLL